MKRRVILSSLMVLGFAYTAEAGTLKFHALMTAASEVPPTTSKATGEASATLDTETHKLTWDVTFAGFKSTVSMAHFHGPAAVGANAGVQVSLGDGMTSPLHGMATLTVQQQQNLMAGQWYANVHTVNNPKGSIRGQMLEAGK